MITIGPHVRDRDDLPVSHRAPYDRPFAGDDRMLPQILLEFARVSMAGDAWIGIVLGPVD
jgi:hypothetical protein